MKYWIVVETKYKLVIASNGTLTDDVKGVVPKLFAIEVIAQKAMERLQQKTSDMFHYKLQLVTLTRNENLMY